jgi:very-short-patch-repair endonuclease
LRRTNAVAEEHKSLCWPINGVPYPFSPGKQALAGRLAWDPELAGLFEFNQKVTTVHASQYLVDLLWPAGKIIVEVDGYKYHGNRAAFSQDRYRDYELVISGYTVLRLPHDEVVGDVMLAVEKIRDIVRFQRKYSGKMGDPLSINLSPTQVLFIWRLLVTGEEPVIKDIKSKLTAPQRNQLKLEGLIEEVIRKGKIGRSRKLVTRDGPGRGG